ncbi:MAG: group 1 glycosyl transferase [Parcubacteria group bacterium Gr01-1014_29]|nr:MAG: group 1 glycosyl transferase [Parcubacteria group bacterium Gr01-1014_29]
MKILLLYEYPVNLGSMSMQGDLLRRGLMEHGVEVIPCHYEHRVNEREWFLKTAKVDAVLGIGWWVDTPTIIKAPQRYGHMPVPWLLADGWVANYHDVIGSLPLVFTTSSWVKETYARDGVDTKNFEVLHVGFDPNLFRPIPRSHQTITEVRRMFGVRDEEKMILTVGGDVTSKGAQEMIRALAKIDATYPHWKYVCKSTNSDCAREHHEEELALMTEMGLDTKKMVYVEDDFSHDFMPYLLNTADIYAAPSRLEGFGMIQVEAMACGTPVVSIDAMGPRDTIRHGETGFLAKVGEMIDLTEEWVTDEMGLKGVEKIYFDKPKTFAYRADIDELADYTLRLLTDDVLRKKLGQAAAEHAKQNFNYHHLAGRCIKILQERLHLN